MWIALIVVLSNGGIFPSHFNLVSANTKEQCESHLFDIYRQLVGASKHKDLISIQTNSLGNTFIKDSHLQNEIHCVEVKD